MDPRPVFATFTFIKFTNESLNLEINFLGSLCNTQRFALALPLLENCCVTMVQPKTFGEFTRVDHLMDNISLSNT